MGRPDDEGVADAERARLDERRDDGAPALVELCLDRDAAGVPVRVGAQIEVGVGRVEDGLEQIVDAGAQLRGDVDEHCVTAVLFRDDPVLGQLAADLLRIGAVHVDLVDRNDDLDARRLRMVDGLDRLGHDAVVRCYDEHGDVGDVGPSRTHLGEGLVAGRVDEGDRPVLTLVLEMHLVGADVLRDAAVLGVDDVSRADRVQQLRLAVVNMAHDGDDRGPRDEVLVVLGLVLRLEVDVEGLEDLAVLVFGRKDLDVVAELGSEQSERVFVERLIGRGHLAHAEQNGDEGGRACADALGEVGEGGACANPDHRGAVAAGNLDSRDHGRGLRLELFALGPSRLAAARGAPALTSERAGRRAAAGLPAGACEAAAAVSGPAGAAAARASGASPVAARGGTPRRLGGRPVGHHARVGALSAGTRARGA